MGRRPGSRPTAQTNALFEKYYATLVPPAEWDAFLGALRRELPLCFRANPGSAFASGVALEVARHFPEAVMVGGELAEPPQAVPWFPGGGCWTSSVSRGETRRDPALASFKQWLVAASESGLVVRQELVSMLPPLLLGAQPHHLVLDACASPGSKTTQLLEAVFGLAPGGVVANELDEKRARMLTHRLKSMRSANIVVVNHDARRFPRLKVGFDEASYAGGEPRDFDRILCDVPCTGDGTLRKAVDLWPRWTPGMARGMHPLQLDIARRCLQLLKVGGRLVYSTCSMSPLENEAVVMELLRGAQGALRLVDCSAQLPGLRRNPGLLHWPVMSVAGEWLDAPNAEVALPSLFPPPLEEAQAAHLDWCWRVAPHHQDTGGFFVALLEKVGPLPDRNPQRHAQRAQPAEGDAGEASRVADSSAAAMEEDSADGAVERKRLEPTGGPAVPVQQPGEPKRPKRELRRASREPPYVRVTPDHPFAARLRQGLEHFGLDHALNPSDFVVRADESFGYVSFFCWFFFSAFSRSIMTTTSCTTPRP